MAKVFQGNKLWMSHLQYILHHAVRQKCPEAADNALTMHDNVTTQSADTVNNVLWHWGVQSAKPPSFNFWPQPSRVQPDAETEAAAAWEMICKQMGYFNNSSAQCSKEPCVRWCQWCSQPSQSLATNCIKPHRHSEGCQLLVWEICAPLSMPQHSNKTMI